METLKHYAATETLKTLCSWGDIKTLCLNAAMETLKHYVAKETLKPYAAGGTLKPYAAVRTLKAPPNYLATNSHQEETILHLGPRSSDIYGCPLSQVLLTLELVTVGRFSHPGFMQEHTTLSFNSMFRYGNWK